MTTKKKSHSGKVAANGQVVIPKELRDALGLKSGDTIFFDAERTSTGLVRLVIRKPRLDFASLRGRLRHLSSEPYQGLLKGLDSEEAG